MKRIIRLSLELMMLFTFSTLPYVSPFELSPLSPSSHTINTISVSAATLDRKISQRARPALMRLSRTWQPSRWGRINWRAYFLICEISEDKGCVLPLPRSLSHPMTAYDGSSVGFFPSNDADIIVATPRKLSAEACFLPFRFLVRFFWGMKVKEVGKGWLGKGTCVTYVPQE